MLMVWQLLRKALMVTAFVAMMMLVIEYINVRTRGALMKLFGGSRASQYLLAVVLGATPGCLGAFVVVALYLHRQVSIGAVVTVMLVTSGDEMFVMLSMFPRTALLMTVGLAALGLAAGWTADLLWSRDSGASERRCSFEIHRQDGHVDHNRLGPAWSLTTHRAALATALVLFLLAVAFGVVGPPSWDWMRITLVSLSVLALFIVATVSDHFLDEHLWRHVVVGHVPRIFLWTWGALAAVALLNSQLDLKGAVRANPWLVLGLAGLIGVIPESGPHLVFATMFAEGTVPFSVLLASSAVQDGHGMLPLLAHSRRDFLKVKLINLVAGVLVGALSMALGR
jgi:Putative, 10TM heavy-metal exporter